MKFRNLDMKWQKIDISKYLIDWLGESPSKFQKSVKDFLYLYWKKEICLEEMPIRALPSSPFLRIDFYNATRKVAIECDGDHHFKRNDHFHKKDSDFHDSVNRDLIKEDLMRKNKIKLVRIYTSDFPLDKQKLEKIHGRFL